MGGSPFAIDVKNKNRKNRNKPSIVERFAANRIWFQEAKVYFWFIALGLMLTRQCDDDRWLKMSELAQGFSGGCSINGSKRHSIKYKGFILVFVYPLLTPPPY